MPINPVINLFCFVVLVALIVIAVGEYLNTKFKDSGED
jgi:hypothetical protein